MSAWNSDTLTVETWEPRLNPDFPGWALVDCGCCAGIRWGGEEPVECSTCGAGGWLHVHLDSGVMAWWPGGPLSGRLDADELSRLRSRLNARGTE